MLIIRALCSPAQRVTEFAPIEASLAVAEPAKPMKIMQRRADPNAQTKAAPVAQTPNLGSCFSNLERELI